MSNARNLARLIVDSNGDVDTSALDNVAGLPDAIDVNASAPADSLAIDSSGNVGIGTTTPGAPLQVKVTSGDCRIRQTTASYDAYTIALDSTNGDLYLGNHYAEGLRIDSSANLKFNSGYGSVATAYGCRAWVNFNGTGTVAIRASGNVSSITDHAIGDYSINFTTAMPNTNYATVTGTNEGANYPYSPIVRTGSSTSSYVRIGMRQAGPTSDLDPDQVCVAIFR